SPAWSVVVSSGVTESASGLTTHTVPPSGESAIGLEELGTPSDSEPGGPAPGSGLPSSEHATSANSAIAVVRHRLMTSAAGPAGPHGGPMHEAFGRTYGSQNGFSMR